MGRSCRSGWQRAAVQNPGDGRATRAGDLDALTSGSEPPLSGVPADGDHFLFWVIGTPDAQGVSVGSLAKQDHHRLLVADGPPTLMLPATILFSRESVLYAQRFDPKRLTLSGEQVTVASGVSINRVEGRRVTASDNGLIAYRPDSSVRRQVTWVDRSGKT